MSSFPDGFPHYAWTAAWSAHSDFVESRVCSCLSVTCQSALLAEWPGSFTCHCGNAGVERTPNKSQHTKLTLEKKILPPVLPGFEFATFPSRVRRFTTRGIPTPIARRPRLPPPSNTGAHLNTGIWVESESHTCTHAHTTHGWWIEL